MKISTFEYFVREAFISMRRNGLMSVASVSTMALSLFILGMFLILVLNLTHLASALESQVQISVYLQDGLSEYEHREIGTRITKMQGVNQVLFVTKAEAMKRFQERLGEQKNLLNALGETNPLPNAFEVKVDKPEQVKAVAKAIGEIKGVENAKYGQEVIEQLFALTKLIRTFGLILIILLALAAIFIIANTIRLTVFARRKEIGIMKYVGATDSFIRWPFLIEGVMLGIGGALLSVLILSQTYGLLVERIYESLAFLPLLPQYPFILQISLLLLAVGMVVGALGSAVSLRRFMKV
ncbi:permease-like cell division protein FtsX [Anaeromusa sp.]|jgi:cell division transport system permease protein|uniref:permease-like cell division protein FtsX n=1 Tax=Anaeromusa sp. TaxID=1872520 RepID=UPI0026264D61|nr:permease-like cell division protein FtsX [Anaeromusa sp.]MDD3157162.1 permease-like cell division protein FtsX [Anaeromusa sp.]MEA4835772.1 permease-like cell division protein FtsX [Anaeromusa sp.]NCB77914.1 ABC transporter permease [Negativicutes bacterium]